MSLVNKLSFEQTPLAPVNPAGIYTVFKNIQAGSFLADHMPIHYRSPAMFTKDIVLSNLAAFGKGTDSLRHTRSRTRDYQRYAQDAVDGYKTMVKSHSISFRTTARGGVAGSTTVMNPEDSLRFARFLSKFYGNESVEKKRKLTEVNTEMDLAKEERTSKRRKTEFEELAGFFQQTGDFSPERAILDDNSDSEVEAEMEDI
jgi:hypothetical protein